MSDSFKQLKEREGKKVIPYFIRIKWTEINYLIFKNNNGGYGN